MLYKHCWFYGPLFWTTLNFSVYQYAVIAAGVLQSDSSEETPYEYSATLHYIANALCIYVCVHACTCVHGRILYFHTCCLSENAVSQLVGDTVKSSVYKLSCFCFWNISLKFLLVTFFSRHAILFRRVLVCYHVGGMTNV